MGGFRVVAQGCSRQIVVIELPYRVIYRSLLERNVDRSDGRIPNSVSKCWWPQWCQLDWCQNPIITNVRRDYRDFAVIYCIANFEGHPVCVETRSWSDNEHHILRVVQTFHQAA